MSALPIAVRNQRRRDVHAGLLVEWITIGWMLIEASVSLTAGVLAGSIALVAFGIDSVIELVSGGVLLWRLRIEGGHAAIDANRVERAERRASRVVGWGLVALAVYVTIHAGYDLWTRDVSEASPVGVALAACALVVMPVLVRAKLRIAASIDSRALRADAMCGIVCAYMAGTLLVGLGLRAAFGWWWADPVAALGLVYFIAREGREALTDRCACGDSCE